MKAKRIFLVREMKRVGRPDKATFFYWMHENKWVLRNIHSVHHRIRNTCALDGNYFHWVEFVLIGSLTMLGQSTMTFIMPDSKVTTQVRYIMLTTILELILKSI
jgi:sterol desaturase/sphingolipid hydroxylase (fatty acid hydroxylase superfamily)